MAVHASKFPLAARCIEQMALLRRKVKFQRQAGGEFCAWLNFRDQRLALLGVEVHERCVAERLQHADSAGGRGRRVTDDDMLRTHTEHNFASAEIDGDGRWQRLFETRTTEAGSSRGALDLAFDEIHRRRAEETGHKLRQRMIVDFKWGTEL